MPDDGSTAVAARQRQREKRERLEGDHDRLVEDLVVVSRPEDSSPAIRRMLGYDRPRRPPQRWEQRVTFGMDGFRLRNVHVGPVDPADAPPSGRARG